MKSQNRFIASITATAKTEIPRLPFERGAARAAMIARRISAQEKPQTLPYAKSA
ncbi:hypothetical protein [Antarctobacter jejuensis]|uniref:hypothetical protein n=1 Tax=Antarctobacter jejuensis TaxID=1439938 RepID=UPI003FD2C588